MEAREPGDQLAPLLTSLILPAFNPGLRLQQTWAELRDFLDQSPRAWEIVFVCDGCTDGTAERLQQIAASDPHRVRVLTHQPNRGKGYAVRRGLAAARGAWCIFTDVDLAYPPSDLLTVAEALWSGADVVIGSRCHADSRVLLPPRLHGYAWRRHWQGVLFGWLARRLLSLRQQDTQAGLKGFSASALRRLLPHLRCDGFGFDCELLLACDRLGLAVSEVPVCVRCEDRVSTTGWRSALATLGELWRVRRRWTVPLPASGRRQPPDPVPKQGANAPRAPRRGVTRPSSGVS